MDVREKLVELKKVLRECLHFNYDEFSCDMSLDVDLTAENLIAHGVTVQELDGCEYCKEDREGYRKMFGAFSITNPFHGNEWFINTWHCKPRKICFCPMCGRRLPQPPKGE